MPHVEVLRGDCLHEMRRMAVDGVKVQAIVTDPPYHLTTDKKGGTGVASLNLNSPAGRSRISTGFMGKEWDGGDVAMRPETWRLAFDLLPPGGHMLVFGGTRTFHRMACAIEDAGFEIRDTIMWVYGSGFPKSHDVSKAIDRAAGFERGTNPDTRNGPNTNPLSKGDGKFSGYPNTGIAPLDDGPITNAAKQWQGWGSALKPGYEPILVCRKPLDGTLAANTLKHGVGGINVDACRIGTEDVRVFGRADGTGNRENWRTGNKGVVTGSACGRWPANLIHSGDASVESAFAEFGSSKSSDTLHPGTDRGSQFGQIVSSARTTGYSDAGTPSRFFAKCPPDADDKRFFYAAKAGKVDRAGSKHPTVKPQSLMRWLCRLVTPPGGTVLDPFAGSGSTLQAALSEGFSAIGIEQDAEHHQDCLRRVAEVEAEMAAEAAKAAAKPAPEPDLFTALQAAE